MYNLRKNKKGLSNLIATTLIIILSLTIIATLGTQIFKLINSPSLSPETSCPVLFSKNIVEVVNSCYNIETGETEIILNRNTEEININSLVFTLDEESYSCSNSCNTCQILKKGTQKYYFNKQATQISLFVNNCLLKQETITNC